MKSRAVKVPSKTNIFSVSGSVQLASIEWGSLDHRRAVAASLTQGVYELEFKRQGATAQHQSPAYIWDHFQTFEVLKDKADSSIFGAIYESKHYLSNQPKASTNCPRYVIALRGTILKHDTMMRDLSINFLFILNRGGWNSRYTRTAEALKTVMERAGNESIWLCGHSQGAAIALQAGRDMAKSSLYIETFLFNPPFASFPIEKIKFERVKNGIRFTKSIITAGINFASKHGAEEHEQEHFRRLCSWIPHMFVHPRDHISSEYIGYFEHKERMIRFGLDGIDRLATEKSVTSWVYESVFGKHAEATHLVPSAYVVKNLHSVDDFKSAHSIAQWWMPLQKCESKLYQTKV